MSWRGALALVLLLPSWAWGQTPIALDVKWDPQPGAVAYEVFASPTGDRPWSIVGVLTPDACTAGACVTTVQHPGVGRVCYRVHVLTGGASGTSVLAACYDPAWEPLVPPQGVGATKP